MVHNQEIRKVLKDLMQQAAWMEKVFTGTWILEDQLFDFIKMDSIALNKVTDSVFLQKVHILTTTNATTINEFYQNLKRYRANHYVWIEKLKSIKEKATRLIAMISDE